MDLTASYIYTAMPLEGFSVVGKLCSYELRHFMESTFLRLAVQNCYWQVFGPAPAKNTTPGHSTL